MQGVENICILGATGSIGSSTIDVIRRNPQRFCLYAVSAFSQLTPLQTIAEEFRPALIAVANQDDAEVLRQRLQHLQDYTPNIVFGPEGLELIAACADVHTVVSAIVGAAGLLPTMAAIKAAKKILLANKESLVMSGQIFMQAVAQYGATLVPVDSEHNAIFQSLPANFCRTNPEASGVKHLLLTASGGPFRELPLDALAGVSPAQACAHPNWDMGKKISVDSASMMNKGLEFIEAYWLFGLSPEQIKVVIHPQSIIHSMVQYVDGSVLAQMGNPDMRTPIAHALAYPSRVDAGVEALDFFQIQSLNFEQACPQRYPNLFLAIEACKQGQGATTALNAANEIAVDAFLNEQIGFLDIYKLNKSVVEQLGQRHLCTIDDVLMQDRAAREAAQRWLEQQTSRHLDEQ